MKQMKMKENEAHKLDGQIVMLEEQKMMIESTHFDSGVVSMMKGSDQTILRDLNKESNIEDMADL